MNCATVYALDLVWDLTSERLTIRGAGTSPRGRVSRAFLRSLCADSASHQSRDRPPSGRAHDSNYFLHIDSCLPPSSSLKRGHRWLAVGSGSFAFGFFLFRFFTPNRVACTDRLEAEAGVEPFAAGFGSAGPPAFSQQTVPCTHPIRGSAEQISSVVTPLAFPVSAWKIAAVF